MPIFSRLRVATAYEYLEHRFDRRTRMLTAFLFCCNGGFYRHFDLCPRDHFVDGAGLAAAPDQSADWGPCDCLYGVGGNTGRQSNPDLSNDCDAVGVLLAFLFILSALPKEVSLPDALYIAGVWENYTRSIFSLRLDTRYTFWSGMTGGLFVAALAYFGTDQTWVQRYLTGGSLVESRLGLLLNGIVKIRCSL